MKTARTNTGIERLHGVVVDEKFNFENLTALIVDNDQYSNEILSQILRGFGLNQYTIVEQGEEAKRRLQSNRYDLLFCEVKLSDISAAELVRWVRRLPNPAVKYIPIIGLTGYTQKANVLALRDSGANFIVSKPIAPNILFDRVTWSAKTTRPFIETDSYVGPCRRFRNLGPPDGVGRRSTDLSAAIGAAVEPNMSQDEIDSLLKPTKISLD